MNSTRPSWLSSVSTGIEPAGNSVAIAPGQIQPRNEGPSRMPPTTSAMTSGCPMRRMKKPSPRVTAMITATCSSMRMRSLNSKCGRGTQGLYLALDVLGEEGLAPVRFFTEGDFVDALEPGGKLAKLHRPPRARGAARESERREQRDVRHRATRSPSRGTRGAEPLVEPRQIVERVVPSPLRPLFRLPPSPVRATGAAPASSPRVA